MTHDGNNNALLIKIIFMHCAKFGIPFELQRSFWALTPNMWIVCENTTDQLLRGQSCLMSIEQSLKMLACVLNEEISCKKLSDWSLVAQKHKHTAAFYISCSGNILIFYSSLSFVQQACPLLKLLPRSIHWENFLRTDRFFFPLSSCRKVHTFLILLSLAGHRLRLCWL